MKTAFKILLFIFCFCSINNAPASGTPRSEHYSISYSGISYYDVRPDLDKGEDNSGNVFNHDFNEGRGNGFRLSAITERAGRAITSLSYVNGTHLDKMAKEEADSDLILFELGDYFASYKTRPISFHAGVQGGLGYIFIRPASDADDEGIAMSVRLFADAILVERFKLNISGLFFGAGYPGETVMKGNFMSLDVGVIF